MSTSLVRDAEYRLLKVIGAREEPVGWYPMRHVDVAPYDDLLNALRSLVAKGLVEEAEASRGRYRLAGAGRVFSQSYEDELGRAAAALGAGGLGRDEAYEIVRRIGQARFRPAQPALVALVAGPDCRLQGAALRVLVGQWGLVDERWRAAAQRLLEGAPDRGCRVDGAATLSHWAVIAGRKDARVLRALARAARDEGEDGRVRQAAYFGLRNALRPDPSDWARIGRESIDEVHDVDWDLVDSHLGGDLADHPQ